MKIHSPLDNAKAAATHAAGTSKSKTSPDTTAGAKNAPPTARPPTASTQVSVSEQTRALEKTGRMEIAEVDVQKVAAVRAAIQNGSFRVDAEAIADKLLANAQEMLTPKKS